MLKKFAAYSFILMANVVLLAHTVIPHHHHHQQVCVDSTHCDGTDLNHTHNTPAQDHQHDQNTNSSTCLLKQAFVIPSTQFRILKDYNSVTDTHSYDFYFLSIFGLPDLQADSEDVTPIRAFPPLISYVTTLPGLRAPPTA